MRKIPTVWQRNHDGDKRVRDEVTPGCEWVLHGEGVPTRKWDGTCCMVRDGRLFRRHELRPGKSAPDGFEPAADPDENTGKQPGWVPVGDGPEDKWHRKAFAPGLPDGTYELIGPKVQGNAEHSETHRLVRHGSDVLIPSPPRGFCELRDWLEQHADIEGIVWHHPDGRMAKIKLRDFGIKRAS